MNMLHLNIFKALVEIVEHHGGNITNDDALINLDIKKIHPGKDTESVTPDELATFTAKSRGKDMAISLLKRCNKAMYGVLVANLEN